MASDYDTTQPQAPQPEGEPSSKDREIAGWLSKVEAREKFFKSGWWKMAERAEKIYNGEYGEDTSNMEPSEPYNILYSNTEVIKPSLYSATPKPDVRARFKEVDLGPVPIAVERFLTILSDPANPGEESLDQSMSQACLSALVPGMGFVRLRYYKEKPVPLCFESGHWKGLIWGAARKWAKVPWVAYRHELTKEEFFSQFKIKGEAQNKLVIDEDADSSEKKDKPFGTVVYELWIKSERRVLWLCKDWENTLIEEEGDVLGLQGFYSTPGLLLMTQKPGKLLPIPLYEYYRNQAEELNRVTVRLNKVLSAIKVRGAYNGLLGNLMEQILDTDDMENKLVSAVGNAALMTQGGGFDKHIWLLPIEDLVNVATQLYQARLQIKQVIYELTGISDIIRGSTVASETATAQDLKNKWGTVRLRDMQKAVADYVRDLYRLATDCGATNIPPEQWQDMVQLGLLTEQEYAVAKQELDHLIAMGQQMAEAGQPPPPEGIKRAQELMAQLKKPTIDSILKQVGSDANRTYTINVQSDSTVDLDTATDKAEVNEFMQALGPLLQGLQPLATLGPTGLNASKDILIAVCQRFKFGLAIVDSLKAVEAPPPAAQGPTPEQQKKEEELKKQEEQIKQLLEKVQDEHRAVEVARKEFAADQQVAKAEMEAKEAVFNAKQTAAGAERQAADAKQEATFEKRKADLNSAATGAKVAQKSAQQAQQQTQPAIQAITQAITALQNAVQMMIEQGSKPRRVVKTPDGYESRLAE